MAIKHKKSIIHPILKIISRFHLLMFFVFMIGALSWAVILINNTLYGEINTDYTSTISAGSIDDATLERIQSLHTSNQAQSPVLPSGRINPFAE